MINQIIKFHKELQKGECVKIITTLPDYTTQVNRTDIIKKVDESTLLILRSNDAKIALNTKYVVMCCTIRKW